MLSWKRNTTAKWRITHLKMTFGKKYNSYKLNRIKRKTIKRTTLGLIHKTHICNHSYSSYILIRNLVLAKTNNSTTPNRITTEWTSLNKSIMRTKDIRGKIICQLTGTIINNKAINRTTPMISHHLYNKCRFKSKLFKMVRMFKMFKVFKM